MWEARSRPRTWWNISRRRARPRKASGEPIFSGNPSKSWLWTACATRSPWSTTRARWSSRIPCRRSSTTATGGWSASLSDADAASFLIRLCASLYTERQMDLALSIAGAFGDFTNGGAKVLKSVRMAAGMTKLQPHCGPKAAVSAVNRNRIVIF